MLSPNINPFHDIGNQAIESNADCQENFKDTDPMWVFAGAIVFSSNKLLTNQHRFISLFKKLQCNEMPCPKPMQAMVESIDIRPGHLFHESDMLNNMFYRLFNGELGVSWPSLRESSNSYTDYYSLNDDSQLLYDFFERYGDDEESLEFFARCAEFLDCKEKE